MHKCHDICLHAVREAQDHRDGRGEHVRGGAGSSLWVALLPQTRVWRALLDGAPEGWCLPVPSPAARPHSVLSPAPWPRAPAPESAGALGPGQPGARAVEPVGGGGGGFELLWSLGRRGSHSPEAARAGAVQSRGCLTRRPAAPWPWVFTRQTRGAGRHGSCPFRNAPSARHLSQRALPVLWA